MKASILTAFSFITFLAPTMVATASTSTAPLHKKLVYSEEGMTVSKTAQRFVSPSRYTMYVFPEFSKARQGVFDVYTETTDHKVWFSVEKLKPKANISSLEKPLKQLLAKIGPVVTETSGGMTAYSAVNFRTKKYEEYAFKHIHNQTYRFHIVHEADWESNALFFAMLNSIQ